MSKRPFFERIYTGEGGIEFVAQRRRWYGIYAIILVICLVSIIFRGFTLGIDFEGGTKITMPAGDVSKTEVADTFHEATGVEAQQVQIIGSGNARNVEIESKHLNDDEISEAREALFSKYHPKDASGKETPDSIGDSNVSNSWGSTITHRMVLALIVFLALIFLYITVRFERDMAIAAISALAVDAIVVSGLYSIIGFEVSPASVIGLLTVLSYSLYDTVVVFDKVHENTAGLTKTTTSTYAEQANLAVNQTMMRSISTSLFSILPIGALMVVAVWLLGVGTLKDLSLVQLLGVIEGTFSSIFLATPILVSLKSRQKKYSEHTKRVEESRKAESSNQEDERVAVTSDGSEITPSESSDSEPSARSSRRRGSSRVVHHSDRDPEAGRFHSREGGGASWRPDDNRRRNNSPFDGN